MEIEDIASKIVAAAMRVHTALGPGLLELAYQKYIQYELPKDGLRSILDFLASFAPSR